MVRPVVRYPDRRLKVPAVRMQTPGPAALRLAQDLKDTAGSFPRTVGIAAPQIGALWRMIYVDCSDHPKVPDAPGPMWLINPIVAEAAGSEVAREGCLSLPEITANVRRATDVTVAYTDLHGSARTISASGFEARVLLHEIDHLDGVLILDRVATVLYQQRGAAPWPVCGR